MTLSNVVYSMLLPSLLIYLQQRMDCGGLLMVEDLGQQDEVLCYTCNALSMTVF